MRQVLQDRRKKHIIIAALINVEITIGADASAIGPVNIDRELIKISLTDVETGPLGIWQKHPRGG